VWVFPSGIPIKNLYTFFFSPNQNYIHRQI
jgi:hypothetical protein